LIRFGPCCIDALPDAVRLRLTLENDDRIYSPRELLPICERTGIPLVYDVHHHRCLADGMSVEEATSRTLKTWNGEPAFWLALRRSFTVEVEAKEKELAVLRLQAALRRQAAPTSISGVS